MLVDDVTIKITAGVGGNGAVACDKNKGALGPCGTAGGRGGSVYGEGVADLGALRPFRYKKSLAAGNGEGGRSQFRDGHDGEDLVLKLPVGTVIHNLQNKLSIEVSKTGERILLARGGKGGKGNFHFRSPINTSPKEFEHGGIGEKFDIRLELKLIADVGFVGLPNVGKSSLLNELTNAKSKVANYEFTTLEPHLGAYYELILADIPGLIEGSSSGKGLGIKFLRHVERTRILFHFISAESENPKEDYKTIRNELIAYNPALGEKIEYVFLSKSDAVSKEELQKKLSVLKKLNPQTIAISIYDEESIKKVMEILNKIKEEK
jgi:GTP-binding protein